MRTYILIVALALGACAHAVPEPPLPLVCPDLPKMASTETLKDYTLHIIDLYDACSKLKNK